MENFLVKSGLRFEVEHHGDRKVFLLPKEDRDRHAPPGDEAGPEACCFCGARSVDRERMYASDSAAICDECIAWLYADLQGTGQVT
jgi:hypothetical protein